MLRRKLPLFAPLLALLLVGLLAACGTSPSAAPTTAAPAGDAATTAPGSDATSAAPATDAATTAPGSDTATSGDLLADVKSRGTLRVSTDSNYAPQSFRTPDGSWEGFDIEVAREIAKRLGVEVEFLDISFDVITAGSWNGRWDVNIGSMTVTAPRKEVLLFSTPYYYTPAAFAVHQDSTAASVTDLGGKKVGIGAATTYLDYLSGSLSLEGEEIITQAPEGATQQVYDTDALALQDLALGNGTRLDAVLTALPTIDNAIKNNQPLKVLGEPVYYEALAVALDKTSALNSQTLADEISRIVEEMRADGTLTRLSNEFYGVDIATKAE